MEHKCPWGFRVCYPNEPCYLCLKSQRDEALLQVEAAKETAANKVEAHQKICSKLHDDCCVQLAAEIRGYIEMKCICGGVPLGVACEPGCPKYVAKRPRIIENCNCGGFAKSPPAHRMDCNVTLTRITGK